jgi:secreted trypsin-like serine protease
MYQIELQLKSTNDSAISVCGRYKKKNENEMEPIVKLPNSQRKDSGSCSMDRISDRYVLTAAHCLGEYTV